MIILRCLGLNNIVIKFNFTCYYCFSEHPYRKEIILRKGTLSYIAKAGSKLVEIPLPQPQSGRIMDISYYAQLKNFKLHVQFTVCFNFYWAWQLQNFT